MDAGVKSAAAPAGVPIAKCCGSAAGAGGSFVPDHGFTASSARDGSEEHLGQTFSGAREAHTGQPILAAGASVAASVAAGKDAGDTAGAATGAAAGKGAGDTAGAATGAAAARGSAAAHRGQKSPSLKLWP